MSLAAPGLCSEVADGVTRNHVSLFREPDAVTPPVRFDERNVETEHGAASEAPAHERAGNRWAEPKPPRHISTLPNQIKAKLGLHETQSDVTIQS